ncbi:PEP-utilizing enzyme [Conexibacter sp. SYSU D00693]|uniref:PEP-utilizing enzyme n=1 Tax=Conexibacter sp. SYSU D00693 TaxID=2812560 RepID=UPI00196AEC06|nr:PEP-utilizing enzyme [Conexibacter sp. SYSU D00693]
MSSAPPDPLMPSERAVHHWTTTNLGEAVPGVMTPLCWSLWGPTGERAARRAAHEIGVLRRDELAPPADPADWVLRPFHGRLTMQLEFMALVGDRLPGTTGAEAIRSMFGAVPPGMAFAPTRARYPAIAVRLPTTFARFPGLLRALAPEQDRWWRDAVARAPALDLAGARALFAQAVARFERAGHVQLVGTLSSIRPLFDALDALVQDAGVGDLAVLSGTGGAEMAVVADIWRASRGELEVADVVARHGFHGPDEGEVSSRVWREDPAPLHTMVARYAARDEAQSPLAGEAGARERLAAAQAEVLAALPRRRRPAAALLLRLAAARLPLRGVAKRSFLQAVDAGRAAARRAGALLEADGVLAAADDVFLLTGEELCGALPDGVREVVEHRRQRRAAHQRVEPASSSWAGLPELVPVAAPGAGGGADGGSGVVRGTGVSAGVVEGVARVVTDPSFEDVEPDEVLVARTTDPSWSSIMFVSSALVVDLGGALSHAAVVARELGVPCVVGTGNGTSVLATGDRVRVDGTAGTVEVLARV